MKRLFYMILLSTLVSKVYAGDVTGKIKVVSVQTHPGWDGVMVQMANGLIVDSQCGNNTWALLKVEDDLDRSLVSLLLTAQTTQQEVRIFTTVCATPPEVIGTIPIITAIDLGIRD